MTPASDVHYVAIYPHATQATEFAENATRIIAGASNIIRTDRTVEFDADALDRDGYSTYSDIALSVGAYGGPGTTLDGRSVPREH